MAFGFHIPSGASLTQMTYVLNSLSHWFIQDANQLPLYSVSFTTTLNSIHLLAAASSGITIHLYDDPDGVLTAKPFWP
jgi:hypothetical protein